MKPKCLLPVIALASLLVALLAGCNEKRYNFSNVGAFGDIQLQERRDREVDFSHYRSFAIGADDPSDPDPLARKQLLWIARQYLEARGYQYTEDTTRADLCLNLAVTNGRGQVEIPARRVLLPRRLPGSTSQTQNTWSGTIGGEWVSGTSTATTSTSDQWTLERHTIPAKRRDAYFPTVGVGLWDPARYQEGNANADLVWEAAAQLATPTADVRITGDMLVLYALDRCPLPDRGPSPSRLIGCRILPLTPDGSTVWPVAMNVTAHSAAAEAGIQEFDIIAEIDGLSTANRPLAESLQRLTGRPGEVKHLVVRRLDKEVKVDLVVPPGGNGR